MSILHKRYERLGPDLELMADEAVLAQAWKKADTYIRRHNWYADILELEQASLLLPSKLKLWGDQILGGEAAPENPLRWVPAPKNAKWHFPKSEDAGWAFKSSPGGETVLDLRPLAHVAIREQTLATAVMLCLADAVETMQGNTDSASYSDKATARQHVFSYGNRLFCDWSSGRESHQQARFRWGNATTYTQFFQDYQRFLDRPAEVCRDMLPSLQGEHLFVVKLDLSKFYDHVDRGRLLSVLSKLYIEYAEAFDVEYSSAQAGPFWSAVEQVIQWTWNVRDKAVNPDLPLGLPQGLVASGFFANAYMHRFDRLMADVIRAGINVTLRHHLDSGPFTFRLLDYCRYVDDMRLVVAVPEELSGRLPLETLVNQISDWVNGKLEGYCKGAKKKLFIKPEKSEAIPWEDFAVQGSTSRFMRGVQGQISNAPDPITLLQATGSLDHLLWLADALEEEADVDGNQLELARISLPRIDVRDDTIKRFAANRLGQVLRLRRSMADGDAPGDNPLASSEVSERKALDHEMETVARKLIACWSRNPSLVTVLRCGMDLFPSPDLLQPVLSALTIKLELPADDRERLVAVYVLADLFKAGAVETGFRQPQEYPDTSNVLQYRAALTKLGLNLIVTEGLPWYLLQQVALYLAVMQYPVTLPETIKELSSYRKLHSALKYERPSPVSLDHDISAGLLVLKMTGRRDDFLAWLDNWLSNVAPIMGKQLVDQVALADPSLLRDILRARNITDNADWVKHAQPYVSDYIPLDHSRRLVEWGRGKRSLAAIVSHPENPFVQENALLKLAEVLLEEHVGRLFDDKLSTHSLMIDCADWGSIQSPYVKLEVEIGNGKKTHPAWAENPPWCLDEMAWAYRLGRLLRSAIIGGDDFTTRFYPLREEALDRYRGLQSTWYKRRMGLAALTNGLGEEPTPVSPWLNELVMRLLQWPGLEINRDELPEFSEVRKPSDLLILIKQRLGVLRRFYGRLSELPVYLLPMDSANGIDLRKFKVALVQTLMPRDGDFCSTDPLHWTPSYRARHRAHLASMCRLLEQQLAATKIASRKPEEQVDRRLDLIVFPELSVHPDDMWLLSRLSDSTSAAIFAGQTFVEHHYLRKPINRAVWLLRQNSRSGRQVVTAYQGKQHGIPWEIGAGVAAHRPYQVLVQFKDASGQVANLTGVICYDATDLRLAADLREVSDGLVVSALNKDINTFDTMAAALQFHMYQPVMLANTGQYGGSTAQAPYKEHFNRHVAHVHGNNQASIILFEIDLLAFKSDKTANDEKEKKAAPAGFKGRMTQ